MLASLLSPSTPTSTSQQPRISQLLPTVKCSTCHQPVPVNELGDHTCEAPPPLPPPPSSVPDLPRPSISPEQATSLLPGRLQSRVAGAPSPIQEHQRLPSSASARLRINTKDSQPGGFHAKPSPLARADSSDRERLRQETPSPRPSNGGGVPFPSTSPGPGSSPLRNRPPPPGDPMRMRTPSNAGSMSNQNTPLTARPTVSFSTPSDSTTPVQGGFRKPSFSNGPPPPRGPPGPPLRNGTPVNAFPPPRSGPSPAPPPSAYNGPLSQQQPYPPARPPTSMSMSGGPRAMGPPPSGPGPGPLPPMAMGRSPAPPPPRALPGSGSNPNSNTGPGGLDTPISKEEFVPPAERGIDTKSGGAAGMAGVGRRGFAAAARAAMFVAPMGMGHPAPGPGPPPQPFGQPMPMYGGGPPNNINGNPQMQNGYGGRRPLPPNAPKFLDIDAATRCECSFLVVNMFRRSLVAPVPYPASERA
ncbi:hypothetical protein CVT26_010500 [Gymnopilus dilepis]|uniref:Uncharacterized protein n=1 Tax=Gymnopilus dilepis TaxID=231916 RepID=A0A409W539_9AGAR|nr:hypothetical protein CVT26_010500 [Gymnopilus dilepis]